MTIAFKCSECDAPLKVSDTLAGKKCKCPKCSTVNDIPDGDAKAVEEKPKTKKVAATVATSTVKAKKKAAEEEELDELPEEETSKKGKAKKAKKGGKGMLIGGVAFLLVGGVLGLCLCGGGGFAVWYFELLGGPPSELRWMPTGTTNIDCHRVAQQRDSKYAKEVEAGTPARFKEKQVADSSEKTRGLATSDIERIVIGRNGADMVEVVTTKSAVKEADLLVKLKGDGKREFEDEKAGKYTIKKTKGGGPAFCVVDSKTILYSGDPKILKAVLERDKAPEFSTAMQNAIKKAEWGKTHTRVSTDNKGAGLGTGKKEVVAEYTIMEEDVGSDLKRRIVGVFKDANDANEAKKEADEGILKMKNEHEKKGIAKEVEINVTVSGNTVTVTWKETAAATIKVLQDLDKAMGGAPR